MYMNIVNIYTEKKILTVEGLRRNFLSNVFPFS